MTVAMIDDVPSTNGNGNEEATVFTKDRIETWMREHEGETVHVKDIADALDIALGYVSQPLRRLMDQGKVVRRKRGYYQYVPEHKQHRKVGRPPGAKTERHAPSPPDPKPVLPSTISFKVIGELRDGRILLEFPHTGDAFVAERI